MSSLRSRREAGGQREGRARVDVGRGLDRVDGRTGRDGRGLQPAAKGGGWAEARRGSAEAGAVKFLLVAARVGLACGGGRARRRLAAAARTISSAPRPNLSPSVPPAVPSPALVSVVAQLPRRLYI